LVFSPKSREKIFDSVKNVKKEGENSLLFPLEPVKLIQIGRIELENIQEIFYFSRARRTGESFGAG